MSRTREEIDKLVVKFENSGLTRAEFSKKEKIPRGTLGYWLRNKKKETSLGKEVFSSIPIMPYEESKKIIIHTSYGCIEIPL